MRLPPRPHFTGKMGAPSWTWRPLPSFAYGSTAPPAHVNACHSLSIKRVKSAEVRISVSWRSHRRKENSNTATSLLMSTMASTQASSQKTRNVLYESEPSFFVAKGTFLYYESEVSNSILVCCASKERFFFRGVSLLLVLCTANCFSTSR